MPTAMIGPKFYAWDENGNPLSFGKVHTYQAGTNKPKATFTGENGETANSNPVILNASGYASIYLAGDYKIVLTDANDVVVWTADPVTDASQRQSDFINERDAIYLGPKKIRIDGDVTAFYEQGRAVRVAQASGFQYGFVRSAMYGAGFTIIDLNGPAALDASVVSAAGGLVTSALFGGYSAEDVADFGYLRDDLKATAGAGMVGTTGGKTVQQRFDTLAEDYETKTAATERLAEHKSDTEAHPALTNFLAQLVAKAQTAADVAALGADIYETVLLGIAGTAAGDFFYVPSEEDDEFIILYKNVSDAGTGVSRTVAFAGLEATKTLAADAYNSNYTAAFSVIIEDLDPGEPATAEVRLLAKKAGGSFTTISSQSYNSSGSGPQFFPAQTLTGNFLNAGENAVFKLELDGGGGGSSITATNLTYQEGNPADAADPIKTFPTAAAMQEFITQATTQATNAAASAVAAAASAVAAAATAVDYEVHATQAQADIDQQVLLVENAAIFGTTEITTKVNAANAEIQAQIDGLTNSGWFAAGGSFEAGGMLTERNQYLQLVTTVGDDIAGGYSWGGALPKVVPPGSTPGTTGDTGPDAWTYRSDATVRQALADGSAPISGTTAGELVADAATAKEALNTPRSDFNRNALGIGVAQSSSVGADWDFTHLDGVGFVSSTVARNHGWLAIADTFQWIDVETPFGVIIGDSIAEGHGSPDRHGRLDTGTVPIFDLDLPNVAGQPSYHLCQKTNMYWYNHGIGGQTSSQVLARFNRDALGQTVAVGDGRPNTTLTRAPYCVWVNVGINDISTGVDLDVTKSNLLAMALAARNAGIVIGFNTCGPHNLHSADQIQKQKDLQAYILNELPKYGAYTFDFRTWFESPLVPDTINPDLRADNVHPRGAGYLSYVSELVKQSAAPIIMQQLCVESKADPDSTPSNFVNAKELRIEHVASGVDIVSRFQNQEAQAACNFDMTNTKKLRMYVSESDLFPPGGTKQVAISRVYGVFGNQKLDNYDSRKAYFTGAHNNSDGFIIAASYPHQDIVDAVVISTTHIRIRFTRPVRNVQVTNAGNNKLYDFAIGITVSPSREALLYIIDKTTGSAINPNDATGTFFYRVVAE